jgi:hypothetical protein
MDNLGSRVVMRGEASIHPPSPLSTAESVFEKVEGAQESIPPGSFNVYNIGAGIFKESMGARN